MKKKLKLLCCLFVFLSLIPFNVLAASGSYSISSNSSVEVGNTISVTFTINASKLFYWQAYITYDTSKLQLVSGSTNFQGESDSINGQSKVTKTLKFKGKKTGNAYVKIAMGDKGNNINSDSAEISFSSSSKTITVKEKKVKTYSSNNYLKSLSVEGYDLSPKFSKDNKEYSVMLPANTESIKINASKEDSNSSIKGDGKIDLSEGLNKLIIKVTAENGNTREYIINATVKELEPIKINIKDESYTVVRKKEQLPKVSSTYIYKDVKIDDNDVPGYFSEITGYTLLALKDKDGNINLYIYNEKDNSYKLYQELLFNKLTVVPIDSSDSLKIPKGYKSVTIKFEEKEITAYKLNSSYPIFIGMNIETGKENLYSYDKEENTIQRINITDNNSSTKKVESSNSSDEQFYIYVIAFLGGFLTFTYLLILFNVIKKGINKSRTKTIISKEVIENDKTQQKKEIETKTSKKEKKEK